MPTEFVCNEKCGAISNNMNIASKEVISCLSKVQAIERYLKFSKDTHSDVLLQLSKSKTDQSSQTFLIKSEEKREEFIKRRIPVKNYSLYDVPEEDNENSQVYCQAFGDSKNLDNKTSRDKSKQKKVNRGREKENPESLSKKASVKGKQSLNSENKVNTDDGSSYNALKVFLESHRMIREFQETGKSVQSWINHMESAIKNLQLNPDYNKSKLFLDESSKIFKTKYSLDESDPSKEAQLYHSLTNFNANNSESLFDFGTDVEHSISDILNQIRRLKELTLSFRNSDQNQIKKYRISKKSTSKKNRHQKIKEFGDVPSESVINEFSKNYISKRTSKKQHSSKAPIYTDDLKKVNSEREYSQDFKSLLNSLTCLSDKLTEVLKDPSKEKQTPIMESPSNVPLIKSEKSKLIKLDWLEPDYCETKPLDRSTCCSKTENLLQTQHYRCCDKQSPFWCCECSHIWQQLIRSNTHEITGKFDCTSGIQKLMNETSKEFVDSKIQTCLSCIRK